MSRQLHQDNTVPGSRLNPLENRTNNKIGDRETELAKALRGLLDHSTSMYLTGRGAATSYQGKTRGNYEIRHDGLSLAYYSNRNFPHYNQWFLSYSYFPTTMLSPSAVLPVS